MTSRSRFAEKESLWLAAFTIFIILPVLCWPLVSGWLAAQRPIDEKSLQQEKWANVIVSLAFLPGKRQLVTSGQTITFYNYDSNQAIRTLAPAPQNAFSFALSPDEKKLAIGFTSGTIKLLDLKTKRFIHTLKGHDSALNLTFSSDGNLLASGSWTKKMQQGETRIWDANTGKLKRKLPDVSSFVGDVKFSPDGKILAVLGPLLQLWDVPTGRLIRTIGPKASRLAVQFSPDGQFIAAGGWGGTLEIWRVDGTSVRTIPMQDAEIRSIAFTQDGRLMAVAASSTTVRVFDFKSGQLLQNLPGHHSTIFSVAFSPDGKFLASGGMDRTLNLWKLRPQDS